jgi:hypothetical protein
MLYLQYCSNMSQCCGQLSRQTRCTAVAVLPCNRTALVHDVSFVTRHALTNPLFLCVLLHCRSGHYVDSSIGHILFRAKCDGASLLPHEEAEVLVAAVSSCILYSTHMIFSV